MDSNEDIIRDFYEHIVSENLLGNLEDFVSEDCTVWADGKSEKVGVNLAFCITRVKSRDDLGLAQFHDASCWQDCHTGCNNNLGCL